MSTITTRSKANNPQACKWHKNQPYATIYLGPGEGPEHAEVVRSARQKGFQSSEPDLYITAGGHSEKIHRIYLMRETPRLKDFWAKHLDSDTIKLKDPVQPCHLSKIANYLYANDYAVFASDVWAYPTNFRNRQTGCRRCDDFLRLLCFHFSLFRAARYMLMEGLEILAIKKFNQVLEVAPLGVIRLAVDEVYSYKPFVHPGRAEMYGIA